MKLSKFLSLLPTRPSKMRSAATTRQNKFLRIITTPYRALCRARDLYVRSVTECGQPASVVTTSRSRSKSKLPRSFSSASSSISSVDSEDYRELVRAASVRTLTGSVEADTMMMMRRQPRSVARSASVGVGMGRIDEEAPFEGGHEVGLSSFGGVGGVGKKNRGDLLYPRSKSYAVMKRNAAFGGS